VTHRERTSTPDEQGRARVGAHTLHYSVAGDTGDGRRPLVLVNGLGANVGMWTPFRTALGARPTIAFDAPGTGGSSTPVRPLSMRELARVALDLLDVLGAGDVDLLGYSFGGAVAQEMARAEPARFHRMVLAASTCGWGALPGDPFALLALLTPARYYFGPATSATTAFFGDGSPRDFAVADTARLRNPPDPVGYAWQLVAALGWSSLAWLHRISVPTLVLGAQRDRMVHPSTASLLARRIPGARLEVVPRAGHFFLLREHNEDVAHRVVRFLDEDQAMPDSAGRGSVASGATSSPAALACT
jgi:pimeloyl-ACP methyl ester carboxylesterase